MMKNVLAIWLLFFPVCVFATIYMQVDKSGNTIYSDTPLNKNATPVNLPPIRQTQPFSAAEFNAKNIQTKLPPAEVERKPYTTFLIVSPKDQESIQNQPVFPVVIVTEPKLQDNDKVQIILDGKLWGEPAHSTRFELVQIDRGTHQLYAVLLDNEQKVLKQSNNITIYIHRVTLNSPTRVQSS